MRLCVYGRCTELVEVFMGLCVMGLFMGLWLNCVFQKFQGFRGFQGVALSLSKC